MAVRYLGSSRTAAAVASRWSFPAVGAGFVDEQARGVLLAAIAVAGASVVALQGGPLVDVAGSDRHRAERPFRSLDIRPARVAASVPARFEAAGGATLTIPLDDPAPVAGGRTTRAAALPRRAAAVDIELDAVPSEPLTIEATPPLADVDRADEAMPPAIPQAPAEDRSPPPVAAPPPAASGQAPRYEQTARGIVFTVPVQINGRAFGPIELLIEGSDLEHPERVSAEISVRLGAIVDLLRANLGADAIDLPMSADQLARYVTLNDLRAHGIAASFDAGDRLILRTS